MALARVSIKIRTSIKTGNPAFGKSYCQIKSELLQLRRMALPQQVLDMTPQRAVLRQARGASRISRQGIGALLRERRTIAASHSWTSSLLWLGSRITPAASLQLTTDRTGRALHAAGNCPQRAALLKTQLDHRALFTTQVFVVRSHRNTLPPGMRCTPYLRPPGTQGKRSGP